jgi:hypothetical protein
VASKPIAPRRFRWRTGECLATYGTSAKIWAAHSSTDAFEAAFNAIIDDATITNDDRADRVEKFLLSEAVTAGVLDELPTHKEVTNPNKWDKHLAPWFNAQCAGTRRQLRRAQRQFGKSSQQAHLAMDQFVQACKKGRAQL